MRLVVIFGRVGYGVFKRRVGYVITYGAGPAKRVRDRRQVLFAMVLCVSGALYRGGSVHVVCSAVFGGVRVASGVGVGVLVKVVTFRSH